MNDDGVKISQLPVVDALADGDVVAGVSQGATKAFPTALLKGQKGDPGTPGAPGPQGEPGKDGSDATVDIQQETGSSTTAVMSQDATTKAINAEAEARESADSAETTARESAISAETDARTQAISDLATKIQADFENYYTKTQTDQMVSAIPKFAIQVVDTLPTENINDTTVYLVPSGEESPNLYVEWIHVDGEWEELGTQSVDLTDYYTKTETDAKFALQSALNSYYTKTEADGRYVAKTDFSMTSTGQSRANNLPVAVVRALDASSTTTATQAKVVANTIALATGTELDNEVNLPMATTSKAGCITAEEKEKMGMPRLTALAYSKTNNGAPINSNDYTTIITLAPAIAQSSGIFLLGKIGYWVTNGPMAERKIYLQLARAGGSSIGTWAFTLPATSAASSGASENYQIFSLNPSASVKKDDVLEVRFKTSSGADNGLNISIGYRGFYACSFM